MKREAFYQGFLSNGVQFTTKSQFWDWCSELMTRNYWEMTFLVMTFFNQWMRKIWNGHNGLGEIIWIFSSTYVYV